MNRTDPHQNRTELPPEDPARYWLIVARTYIDNARIRHHERLRPPDDQDPT